MNLLESLRICSSCCSVFEGGVRAWLSLGQVNMHSSHWNTSADQTNSHSQHRFTGNYTWKENRDRVVSMRTEIGFLNVVFSDFSRKVPFHHRPGKIERISFYFRTILRSCQSLHVSLSNQSEVNIISIKYLMTSSQYCTYYPNTFKFVISP